MGRQLLQFAEPIADSHNPYESRFNQTQSIFTALLAAASTVLGISVCSIALTYTGAYPVNIFVVLGVIVFLPLGTLLLTLLSAMLRAARSNRTPGFTSTTYLQAMTRRLDHDLADYFVEHAWRYADIIYWSVQRDMQLISLAFLTSAAITFLLLITFSDIAFGWSSTLNIAPQQVHGFTQALSFMWADLLPLAHPSADLVVDSRFYRMSPDNNPERLGLWWPFIAMCILVWGFLPRLLMFFFCRYKVRRTLEQTLLNHPQVTALTDLLNASKISFDSEVAVQTDSNQHASAPLKSSSTDSMNIISWNLANPAGIQAGYGDSSRQIDAVFEQLSMPTEQITIQVKGWEPPLLEFNDFVELLRAHAGRSCSIVVELISLPDLMLDDDAIGAWRATVGKLRDPETYVQVPR